MTTEVLNRPVKYAALEWRNAQGEKFEAIQEGTLCYLKDETEPYTGKAVSYTRTARSLWRVNFEWQGAR